MIYCSCQSPELTLLKTSFKNLIMSNLTFVKVTEKQISTLTHLLSCVYEQFNHTTHEMDPKDCHMILYESQSTDGVMIAFVYWLYKSRYPGLLMWI